MLRSSPLTRRANIGRPSRMTLPLAINLAAAAFALSMVLVLVAS